MKNLLLVYLLLVLCSCEKDYDKVIEVDFPYTTNVICLMYDDALTTEVHLSRIYKLGEPTTNIPYYYAEANVSINDGLQDYYLSYDSIDNTYGNENIFKIDSGLFKVIKGKSYTLKIVLADGSLITSSCTVPVETLPTVSYTFNDVGDYKYSYAMNWTNDSPNEKYYISQFFFYYVNTTPERSAIKTVTYKKPLNETSVSLTGVGTISPVSGGSAAYINPVLYYTTEETYRYYDSALKNVSGDLYGEPAVVSTNIQGGTGVFGPLISQ